MNYVKGIQAEWYWRPKNLGYFWKVDNRNRPRVIMIEWMLVLVGWKCGMHGNVEIR